MKFKTWEKIYWGILSFFFVASVIMVLFQEGDIRVKVFGETKMVSKLTFVGYSLLGYVIFFVPLWLLIRWIVNSGDKRERERERA